MDTAEDTDVRAAGLSVLGSLELVPRDVHVALLLRHAHRNSLPPGEFGDDAELTSEGVRTAEELGAALCSRPIGRILTSPVPRCVSTATAVVRGAGWGIDVATDLRLGGPGPFVADPVIAGPLFLELGTMEVVRRQLSEPDPPPGMRPTAGGVSTVLNLMLENLGDRAAVDILVTHDAILAGVVGYLVTGSVNPENWPSFLEGLFVWRDQDGLRAAWRGRSQIIDEDIVSRKGQ